MKNNYLVLRLQRGADLYESIVAACVKERLQAGCVVTAVGCVSKITIRTADGMTVYSENKDFEVTALSGTVSADGLHVHIQVCDKDLRSFGGHLLSGTIVNTTMEIVLVNLEKEYQLTRSHDSQTGYDELEVYKK